MVVDQSHDSTVAAKRQFFASLVEKYGNVDAVPDSEWRKVLTDDEFYVARQSGTEPAHSGPLTRNFKPGRYTCICCGADLFISEHKYSCEHGWPSFSESLGQDKNIERRPDTSFGLQRTEVRCKLCHSHLGHVFEDKHSESSERYCINSLSINFEEAETSRRG